MTDNRTNEQIVAETLVAHCESFNCPVPGGATEKIVAALRTAGRLAGETKPTEAKSSQDFVFTEAQVEAAAAYRREETE